MRDRAGTESAQARRRPSDIVWRTSCACRGERCGPGLHSCSNLVPHTTPRNGRCPCPCTVTTVPSSPVRSMDRWAYHNQVQIDFSRPGKPTDNAHVESFNGTLGAECLAVHWFASLAPSRSSNLGGANTMRVVLTDRWKNERRVSSPVRSP